MEQMEILKQWLTQEKIRFEYYYEPFIPEILEDLEKHNLILNEDMKTEDLNFVYDETYGINYIKTYV